MAGMAPGGFDDALRSLMRTAEGILPGNRADLLLLDENDHLEMRASVGEASLGTERGRSAAVPRALGGGPAASGVDRPDRRERARLRPRRLRD